MNEDETVESQDQENNPESRNAHPHDTEHKKINNPTNDLNGADDVLQNEDHKTNVHNLIEMQISNNQQIKEMAQHTADQLNLIQEANDAIEIHDSDQMNNDLEADLLSDDEPNDEPNDDNQPDTNEMNNDLVADLLSGNVPNDDNEPDTEAEPETETESDFENNGNILQIIN